ncbi:MAG TPA: acyl carrier protein [Lachnospiraceae bacterium]|jgi:acyl carrier protein|nr:acyl carrier protein [Lachnospiraceae bacterium]
MTILERLTKIMEDNALLGDIDVSTINDDTTFDDLDLDSLDQVDMAMSCEEEFGISIDLENPPKTVGELVSIIKEQTGLEE